MKEQQLRKIMNEILNHEDYGKRNPIDIGGELGYSPNEILEAMNMPNMEKKEEEKKEYLLLNSGQVVAFDLLKRKASVVKTLDENVDASIKNGILIWTNAKGRFEKATELYWENFKTGGKGEFPLEKLKKETPTEDFFGILNKKFGIGKFYVLSDGVMVDAGFGGIYKINFKGDFYKLNQEIRRMNVVIETDKKIYIASNYEVWSMKKDLSETKKICKYSADDNTTVAMLECVEDSVFLHVFKEGWNSYYHRYNITEDSMQSLNEYPFLSGKFSDKIAFMANPEEIVTTENYVATKNAVYPRTSSSAVWGKNDSMTFFRNTVHIYQEDIILGEIKKMGENKQPEIAMFDLKKSKSPIFFEVRE
ncbi:MAG: hypothetical protein ACLRTF_07635 [Blautia sp.]